MRRILALSVIFVGQALSACGAIDAPQQVSVCEVAGRPQEFSERNILLPASIYSDGFEFADFVDLTCPRRGIRIEFSNGFLASDSGHRILEFLFQAPGDPMRKRVSGLFEGKVIPNPHSENQYVFEVHDVSQLNIELLGHPWINPKDLL